LKRNHLFHAVIAGGIALAGQSAHAQLVPPVESVEVNLAGLAVGGVPDYMGSSHNKGAAGPMLRYQFEGSKRYFLWLGPQMQLNLIDDEEWRAGPYLNFRSGRGTDVDDAVVKQMVGINNTVEGGAFVQYNMKLSSAKFHQLVFSGDLAGGSNGTVGHLRMMWWQPLREGTILNLGLGTTIANDKWMQTYFGVNNPHDIGLYPSLGGLPFNAGSGVSGVNIPFGITQMLSREWLVSVGGRYEKLQGDAKDSPVVSQRGDSNQWVIGAGLSYMF